MKRHFLSDGSWFDEERATKWTSDDECERVYCTAKNNWVLDRFSTGDDETWPLDEGVSRLESVRIPAGEAARWMINNGHPLSVQLDAALREIEI